MGLNTVRLTFTKRNGKHDELLIERPGNAAQRIDCPKQGTIPHDMVHYAVESIVAARGFLTLVADGQTPGFSMQNGDDSPAAVERIVEVIQAELWSGRIDTLELIANYEIACSARGHGSLPLDTATVDQIRDLAAELGREWAAVSTNASMVLEM